MEYPHSHIWVNGRRVSIKDVVNGGVSGETEAERSAFAFIKDWHSGQQDFILHTSGSTGTPKPISISRSQMVASAEATIGALGLSSNHTSLVAIDTRYIGGKMMIVRALHAGMRMFIVDPVANPLVKIPVDRTIDFTALVPYQVTSILESKHPHLLDKLSDCLIGGAPLDERSYAKLCSCSARFHLTYGMTETVSHVALQKIDADQERRVYKTLPGITISADERGCLVIGAPYLAGKITTNDIVTIISDTEFEWKGRADNIINSGGVKLSPEDIEKKIGKIFTRLNISNRFFVHHCDDAKLGQRAVLVTEGAIGSAERMHDFRQALKHTFAAYEIPKEIYESTSFILGANDKINRRETFISSRLRGPIDA